MESADKGSVSLWLDGLRADDSRAAQELWNRYFSQLVRIAHNRLRTLSPQVSGQDIALSALASVMAGVRENRFPDLVDRNGLWPVLVTIVVRKAISQMRRQLAQKRGGARTTPLSELMDALGTDPPPELATALVDELDHLIGRCGDPTLRQIAQRKLEGCTHAEIAVELGCSERTVIRKLNRIRQEWEAADAAHERSP